MIYINVFPVKIKHGLVLLTGLVKIFGRINKCHISVMLLLTLLICLCLPL